MIILRGAFPRSGVVRGPSMGARTYGMVVLCSGPKDVMLRWVGWGFQICLTRFCYIYTKIRVRTHLVGKRTKTFIELRSLPIALRGGGAAAQ